MSNNLEMKQSSRDLHNLLNQVATLQRKTLRARLVTGNVFTPFAEKKTPRATGIKIDELLASSVLATLLDPDGNHGQGEYFLEKFLSCAGIALPNNQELKTCKTQLEQRVKRIKKENNGEQENQKARDRRIDMTLEFKNVLIGIEVKLDAEDGEDQLTDYMNHLIASSRGRQFYLVYLTLEGREPDKTTWNPEKLTDQTAINYLRLCSWRELSSSMTASPDELPLSVSLFVNNFYKAIRSQYLKEEKMPDYPAVIDFLDGPEVTDSEIKAAHGIYSSFSEAADRIIQKWASRVKSALEADREKGEITAQIYANIPYGKSEFDYLLINWPQREVGVLVASFIYPLTSEVAANTLLWGPYVFNKKGLANHKSPFEDELISKLAVKYNAGRLTGNMIDIYPLKEKTNPDQLNDMRNKDHIFMYKKIYDFCKDLEKFLHAYDENHKTS